MSLLYEIAHSKVDSIRIRNSFFLSELYVFNLSKSSSSMVGIIQCCLLLKENECSKKYLFKIISRTQNMSFHHTRNNPLQVTDYSRRMTSCKYHEQIQS